MAWVPPAVGRDIVEPSAWPFDGGTRREPVVDPNWDNRVIRRVGWRRCMRCSRWFFSRDVVGVRLHPDCGDDALDRL